MVLWALLLFQGSNIFTRNSYAQEISASRRSELSPSEQFRVLAHQRDDYLLFVGVPPSSPKAWAKVSDVDSTLLSAEGYGFIPLVDIVAFVVAYPNGQVVSENSMGLGMPDGIYGIYSAWKEEHDVLKEKDLELGKLFAQVTYGPSSAHPDNPDEYSTTVRNISNEKFRVVRFGGYWESNSGWRLATVTNQFFSADEFIYWYGLGEDQWILPGQAATDHNNYGSPPSLWAYYCETESGKKFIAGGVVR